MTGRLGLAATLFRPLPRRPTSTPYRRPSSRLPLRPAGRMDPRGQATDTTELILCWAGALFFLPDNPRRTGVGAASCSQGPRLRGYRWRDLIGGGQPPLLSRSGRREEPGTGPGGDRLAFWCAPGRSLPEIPPACLGGRQPCSCVVAPLGLRIRLVAHLRERWRSKLYTKGTGAAGSGWSAARLLKVVGGAPVFCEGRHQTFASAEKQLLVMVNTQEGGRHLMESGEYHHCRTGLLPTGGFARRHDPFRRRPPLRGLSLIAVAQNGLRFFFFPPPTWFRRYPQRPSNGPPRRVHPGPTREKGARATAHAARTCAFFPKVWVRGGCAGGQQPGRVLGYCDDGRWFMALIDYDQLGHMVLAGRSSWEHFEVPWIARDPPLLSLLPKQDRCRPGRAGLGPPGWGPLGTGRPGGPPAPGPPHKRI